jgi:D-alanyl-D-alanine carboxypeptidase/D-alanyl-D-alanine-endopeptidase (penicillin-binding protein 4)
MSSSRRRFLSGSLLVLSLWGPACASRTAGPAVPGAAPPAVASHDELTRTLDTLFATAPADRVVWGVSIRVPGGAWLYQRNAMLLLHPASNMKLVTLAASAERLGWDYRFTTTIRSTTPIDDDGTLAGDLVVIGGGDPTISRRHEGAATLAHLADLVWQRGVRRIEGRVIGDGSAFGGTSYGEGWQWDDLPFSYAAPVNALIYNENTAEFVVAPGPSAGALATMTAVDAAADMAVVNRITTVASGAARRLSVDRGPDDPRVTIRGEVPLGYVPFKQYLAIADPPAYFARAFRQALIARGIAVVGAARSSVTDPPGRLDDEAGVSIRHQSPPLRQMAATLMKVSQNLYAEVLFHALGKSVGDGSTGAEAIALALPAWGADPADVVAADGSGLSRYDLTSAAALDALLSHMFISQGHREPWVAALPIAGVDGTLERRMKGTPAEGRVHAKTGSIAYVRALAGYVHSVDGQWLQFVILANNFAGKVTTADVDRITEQAVNLLVGFSRKAR